METGHTKNAANFETALIVLTGLNSNYDPRQELILLAALQSKLTQARDALAAVDTAEAAKKIAVDERFAEFEDLEKYLVNIKRAAAVEVNNEAFTEDLMGIIRKFRSGGQTARSTAENPAGGNGTPPRRHSTSARSYDNQIGYLADIIALLKTQGEYKPNEPEMKIPAIEAHQLVLEAKNNAAKAAAAALGVAMDARDEILYNDDTGVIKLVKLIKTHLARSPGKQSAAYRQINALEFKKFK